MIKQKSKILTDFYHFKKYKLQDRVRAENSFNPSYWSQFIISCTSIGFKIEPEHLTLLILINHLVQVILSHLTIQDLP